MNGFIHQHNRAVHDACVFHGVTTYPKHERGLGVFDELLHQVKPCDGMVVGRRGEASLHGGWE